MKHFTFIILMVTGVMATSIQVIDQQSGKGMPGVNITIVGTPEGLNTDLEGYFTLDASYAGQRLKFSYIGYTDTTLGYDEILNMRIIHLTPDILNLSSVEVISSKLEWEQADLPSLVTVLRTRELVNQGSIELRDALQRDPSVVVQESYAGTHEISIRGSNADEVLILYDGIPLNSSYLGGFDLSWINLNDIDAVSIIKGAGTLKYGSGAFGGVVVLDPIRKSTTGFDLNYQRSDQSLNGYNLTGQLNLGRLNTRLSLTQKEQLPYGFYNADLVSERNFINSYSVYSLKDSANTLSVNFMDVSEELIPNPQIENKMSDSYTQLKYSGGLGPLKNMIFQVLHRNNTSEGFNLTDPDFEFINSTAEKLDLFALENKWIQNNLVNLSRAEVKRSEYSGVSNTKNVRWEHDDFHDINLLQDWIAFSDVFKYRTELGVPFVDYLELNASFRYDLIKMKKTHQAFWDDEMYQDLELEDDYDQISKRNGFTLQKNRKNLRYQLFYTSGTNMRYPSLSDLYLRDHTTIGIYIDQPLLPELNSSNEFGLQASIQPANSNSVLEHIDLQASLYKNKYVDKIYHTQIPRALPTPVNMTTTQLGGMEASMMASLLDDRLRFSLGTHRLNISSYTIFPNKPKFRDVMEIEMLGSKATLRLQYYHEGKQFYGGSQDNINWVVTEVPGRENCNLYSSFRLDVLKTQMTLGISVLNVLSDDDEANWLNQRKWTANIGFSI